MSQKNDIVLVPSYWASVSGGKDSLYMLNLILKYPDLYKLDGVVHFELEIDYPFIKNVIDYMESKCKNVGIPFVRIKPEKSWEELYNKYGYPDRLNRWCNHQYKLNCKKQLKNFLKSQNSYLINYIGICFDETKRIKNERDVIYPLVDFGIYENDILEWAKTVPIFNDYYLYNKRCGCMGCPCSSLNELVYLKKYYPEYFNYFFDKALITEKYVSEKIGKPYSLWSGNSKYNTQYKINRVNEILSQTTLF